MPDGVTVVWDVASEGRVIDVPPRAAGDDRAPSARLALAEESRDGRVE